MSGEKCSITCNVKDSKGNVKVSTLWENLAKFFKGDRANAVAHYFLTKDSKFLMENSDILEFDVDGEVTIASLKKAIERGGEYTNLSNARTLQHLNDELGNAKYDYSEALDNVLKFNRSNQFRDGFMATLKRQSDGKYKVEVVERNPTTEYELADHVSNKILTDSIRRILLDRGLSVEFLDNPSYAVKYSTHNVQPNADGMIAVAEVLNGVNSSEATAEAAGHFIVAAMEGNPLIDRLTSALTPEVQMAIFKDKKSPLYRQDFSVSDLSAREAAGILLGKELIQPFEDAKIGKAAKAGHFIKSGFGIPKAIKWLLHKVANFVRTVIGKETPDDIYTLVQRAKDAASTAAQGFITNPDLADTNKALDKGETYTHFSISKQLSKQAQKNTAAFYETLGSLKDTVIRLKTSISRTVDPTNKSILKSLEIITEGIESDYGSQLGLEAFANEASITGIVVALEGITQVLDNDVRKLLDTIQPSDRVSCYTNLASNAASMRTLNTTIKNIAQIYDVLSKKLDDLNSNKKMEYPDKDGNHIHESLREALKRLGDVLIGNEEVYVDTKGDSQVVNGLQKLIELKRRQIFVDAIRDFYGEDFINMNFGKVWQQKGFGRYSLVSMNKQKAVQDFVDYLEEDISLFDRWLSSAADCADFVTAIGNKATKEVNMDADRLASKFWDQIETLRIQMQDAFGTTDCTQLYETIIDNRDYDAYDKAKKEFSQYLKTNNIPDTAAAWEQWHKDNSELDINSEGKIVHIPNSTKYHNPNKQSIRRTGNLVTNTNYGAWERERKLFKEQLKKDFFNYLADFEQQSYEKNKGLKGYVFSLTDEQKGILYHNFADSRWKQWHAEHSEVDPSSKDGKKYIPNHIKYHSTQWDELFDASNPSLTSEEVAIRKKRLAWYDSLMDLKGRMDAILPKNSTVLHRAPQLTGRFGNKFRNLRDRMGNSLPAFGHALRKTAEENFMIKPDEAWMFGTESQYCEIEEDPFENPLYFEKEKIDRLPIYGIHKLKNMDDLSTDLFGALTQYGSMAATYGAMSHVVDIFEIGKDVLKERMVGNKSENNKNTNTRALGRYIKFVDKDCYGLNVTPPKWDRKGLIRKVANNLSALGGKILLAGNIPGGIVNTGTGMLEIFKEAAAGENFNLTELHKAHAMYWDLILTGEGPFGMGFRFGGGYRKGSLKNMLTNPQRAEDKNSLWIRHWNILSRNRTFLHNQHYDTDSKNLLDKRLWDYYNHMLMLPYSSGDHYMQTVPYYAMGIHEKVYTQDGTCIPLIDAYEIVDGEEIFASDDDKQIDGTGIGRNHKKVKLKDGIFKSLSDIDKYETITDLQKRINKFFSDNPLLQDRSLISSGNFKFTDAELQFLSKEEFSIPVTVKQLSSLNTALNLKKGEYLYNEKNESAFMDKCRNICNRLHGIYNSEDKTAFQQNFYGHLVMSMRGYALGMVNRRYAGSHYNVPQGKVVEGSYNTAFKVLVSSFMDIGNADNWKAAGEAILMMSPFGYIGMSNTPWGRKFSNKLKVDMLKAGFSEHQYYNIRRTTADFLVLEALALLNFLSSPGKHFGLSDDDEEDKRKGVDTSDNMIYGWIYYLTTRWFNEQGAFTFAPVMWKEGNSLLNYVPTGFSGMKAIWDIGTLFMRTQMDKIGEQDLDNSKLYYQSSKDGKYEVGDEKWWIKAKRLMPYVRSWYTITHPYDATASYEYGRKVRN